MKAAGILTPEWQVPPRLQAGCTTRQAGDLAGLRQQVPGMPSAPRWLAQVHGVAVADLDRLAPDAPAPVADASFTTRPGVVCVVRTADCLPVLLAAGDGSAVAAVHAGWRGLAAGVIEATVQALRARMPRAVPPLQAWMGPAISRAHFEVGEEVRAAFLAADPDAGAAFEHGHGDRWMCDLYALARRRLAVLGIHEVAGGGLCTYADEQHFHSHRRDVQHRGLDATGRMASFIWFDDTHRPLADTDNTSVPP